MADLRPIRRTPLAEADLMSIWRFIARDNERAADKVIDRILRAIARLEEFPYSGRARDDALAGVRTLSIKPYVVVFRVGSEAVEVLRVVHGARNLHAIEPDESYRR